MSPIYLILYVVIVTLVLTLVMPRMAEASPQMKWGLAVAGIAGAVVLLILTLVL